MPCFFGPSCFVPAVRSHIYFEVDRWQSHTKSHTSEVVGVGLKSNVCGNATIELRIPNKAPSF